MIAPGTRLLVLNTSRSWGGTEFWAVQAAAGLARRGVAVRFLVSGEPLAGAVAAEGLDHGRVCLRADGDLFAVMRLCREFAGFRPHAVLATRWREFLLAGLAARMLGPRRPRFALGLGQYLVPRDDLKRRLIFRLADRVIVNAPEIREGLLQRPWISPGLVAVVINGLDLATWRPRWEPASRAAGAALRARFGIPSTAPLLLSVGSLTPVKGHSVLLHAMARLRERLPGVRLLILGEGFLRAELEAQRRRLGLDGIVLMPGFTGNVAPAMAAADLLVLSSTNEGMAWVLIEAAASGLPAVATDVSGTRHAVDHRVTGLVVPPCDSCAMARAAEELLADPALRRTMGLRARDLAEERFTADRMLDQLSRELFA